MNRVQGSRLAFAAAYFALVVGLFIALGGAAYAQETPASDQYTNVSDVSDVSVSDVSTDVAGVSSTSGGSSGGAASLPNTGLSLLATTLVAAGLIGAGVALRRRERRGD